MHWSSFLLSSPDDLRNEYTWACSRKQSRAQHSGSGFSSGSMVADVGDGDLDFASGLSVSEHRSLLEYSVLVPTGVAFLNQSAEGHPQHNFGKATVMTFIKNMFMVWSFVAKRWLPLVFFILCFLFFMFICCVLFHFRYLLFFIICHFILVYFICIHFYFSFFILWFFCFF